MSFTRHLHRSRLGTSLSSYAYARRMISSSTREFKVILDNETLYVPQPVAEALGWNPVCASLTGSVPLILHGWNPQYFSITQAGTESDAHARRTVEDAQNPEVRKVLKLLKEYDAK